MPRDRLLQKVRTALGRTATVPEPPPPPDIWTSGRRASEHEMVLQFEQALTAAGGTVHVVPHSSEARAIVASLVSGQDAVASESEILRDAGILSLPEIRTGFRSPAALRDACRDAASGVTGVDFAIASTGTLVMIASAEEARLTSLLPPQHIALVPRTRLVADLSELFERVPDPAAISSALIFITGPSRTADIEQILVRGVHGPRTLHAIVF
jgi:L-lactate dehydrogenase complex protein LldG